MSEYEELSRGSTTGSSGGGATTSTGGGRSRSAGQGGSYDEDVNRLSAYSITDRQAADIERGCAGTVNPDACMQDRAMSTERRNLADRQEAREERERIERHLGSIRSSFSTLPIYTRTMHADLLSAAEGLGGAGAGGMIRAMCGQMQRVVRSVEGVQYSAANYEDLSEQQLLGRRDGLSAVTGLLAAVRRELQGLPNGRFSDLSDRGQRIWTSLGSRFGDAASGLTSNGLGGASHLTGMQSSLSQLLGEAPAAASSGSQTNDAAVQSFIASNGGESQAASMVSDTVAYVHGVAQGLAEIDDGLAGDLRIYSNGTREMLRWTQRAEFAANGGAAIYHTYQAWRSVGPLNRAWDAHQANPTGDSMIEAARAMGDFFGSMGSAMNSVAGLVPLPPGVGAVIGLFAACNGDFFAGLAAPFADRVRTLDSITSSETMYGGEVGPTGHYVD